MDLSIITNNPLGIISITISITFGIIGIYKWTRKSLSYNDKVITPLIRKEHEIKDKIKLLFNNEEVKQVYLAIIKIFNSGNVAIVKEDFDTPITIGFGKDSTVLTSEITERYDSLKVETEIKNDIVEVKPLLLNKKDWFTLKILVSNHTGERPKISGRIKGVKRITYSDEMFNLMKSLFFVGGGVMAFTGIYLGWAILSGYAREHYEIAMANILYIGMIGVFLIIVPTMWLDYHTKKRKIEEKQTIKKESTFNKTNEMIVDSDENVKSIVNVQFLEVVNKLEDARASFIGGIYKPDLFGWKTKSFVEMAYELLKRDEDKKYIDPKHQDKLFHNFTISFKHLVKYQSWEKENSAISRFIESYAMIDDYYNKTRKEEFDKFYSDSLKDTIKDFYDRVKEFKKTLVEKKE